MEGKNKNKQKSPKTTKQTKKTPPKTTTQEFSITIYYKEDLLSFVFSSIR